MSWVRVQPDVTEGTACSGNQIGTGYAAAWVQIVEGEGVAAVTRTFYRVQDGSDEHLECQNEYVLGDNADDPADGEICCKYAYVDCGPVDSNAEVYLAALNAPAPTDEEWLTALAAHLAAA